MDAFIVYCDKIEEKFINDNETYFFGDTPSIVDHVFYQEMVSAMLISKKGNLSKFFKDDTATRLQLKKLTDWYKKMSENQSSKKYSF